MVLTERVLLHSTGRAPANQSFMPPLQVLGRLLDIFVTASSIQQLRRYTCSDPIAPNSFASPQLKVGLSILVLLLSLGTFAQACRLAGEAATVCVRCVHGLRARLASCMRLVHAKSPAYLPCAVQCICPSCFESLPICTSTRLAWRCPFVKSSSR